MLDISKASFATTFYIPYSCLFVAKVFLFVVHIMFTYPQKYDVIVVGAGHAGCEAALATSRMSLSTLLLTINLDTVAQMSCNPAIGGLAKGQLVREIDALGGEMAKNIDQTGIQFRMLNTNRGPAVWGPRAQADKKSYQFNLKYTLEKQKNLDLKQELVEEIAVKNKKAIGVITHNRIFYPGKTIIVTTGTFLKGLIHIGELKIAAGRAGEFPAEKLSANLRKLGFEIGRLKTGTPPRINRTSIDFSRTEIQKGDKKPSPFSFSTEKITQSQIPCYITYTNEKTHKIIRKNLHRAPLYTGQIKGTGPRYCPSIEVKIVNFPEKERHQIFLEPEGKNTGEIYLNGLATSIPVDIQLDVLRTITGLKNAVMMRPGYAIEYDFVFPYQIKATLETKLIENLYFAGQINGTSGYEEAAAQGIIAGINAALKIKGKSPFILDRSQAYIGVLIDDLITKKITEPYRMFTSRAEYRLLLRQDNADLRLMEYGHKFGLIKKEQFERLEEKRKRIKEELSRGRIHPTRGLDKSSPYKETPYTAKLQKEVLQQVEIELKYKGYIQRELKIIKRFKAAEKKRIPSNFDYVTLYGLSSEAREKLIKIKPTSFGQASRIDGLRQSDLSILLIHLRDKE